MTFQLDTTGYVQCPAPDQKPNETTGCWFWPDLTPFAQGYIEASMADLYKPEARGWTWSHAHGGYIRPTHLKPGTTGDKWDDMPSDVCAAEAWEIDTDGEPPAFYMLAPETLARIIADCEAMQRLGAGYARPEDGANFWRRQQAGEEVRFRFEPATVALNDAGKVVFS